MGFNTEEKKDYANYLRGEINKTSALRETMFTNFYINNLYRDLNDIKRQLITINKK